jgi:hypothetical protein
MYVSNINDLSIIKNRNDIPRFLNKMQANRICEIGVKDGGHFREMFIPCVKLAVAIDIWTDTGIESQNDDNCPQDQLDKRYTALLNMYKNNSRVNIIKDYSLNACKMFEDGFFDFVYIDADHTEQAVYEDLNSWYFKIRSGGVLAGHDYCECVVAHGVKFGVISALKRFTAENNLPIHVDNDPPWYNWFIPKP